MLASIWRHPQRHQHSCMIMVGDPKQAIYGFRGGDMLTYIKARQDVLIKQGKLYTLRQNHRSVPELVEVVDALFQREVNFGEEVIYTPIQAGARQHPPLTDRQRKTTVHYAGSSLVIKQRGRTGCTEDSSIIKSWYSQRVVI